MKNLAKYFTPEDVESKWYSHWKARNYFRSIPDDREPFTIVIPPPNVTGVLHMGHILNNTIQDILIRKARMDGKNACWVPGTDHASIATEAKVVRLLRSQGIKKSDLSREEFMAHAWDWTDKYGGIILKQLERLGASCDWDRTAFTMDEIRSEAVIRVFVDLYRKNKLYRGLRMVNWDPEALTVLSNEEVIHQDEQSFLYHLKYKIAGSDEYLTIATQRPETIMGDTAVAVHPDDERYKHLAGKKAIIPLIGREVPIIFDDYVDMEFGTGALKVTPAHDPNDYEIGKRHNLEVVDTLNDNGTLNEKAQLYIGLDRFEARKQIVKDLKESEILVNAEPYTTSIGRSERTNAVVEPKLSLQWYVNMSSIAEPALRSVMEDDIKFFPEKYKNTYRHWMENIRDWCISRQLWWGHRIPAWYYGEEVFVAETAEEALNQAREKFGTSLTLADLAQDEDVLDTWFSSWLWPISVFDGFNKPEEVNYYYPTDVVVTGWDIIFLWIARMIMSGYEWRDQKPFKAVYFTGMVRDEQRRKMSKSLGNSPDALELIEKFGADGVRFGMLSSSPAGGDLLFNEKLCEQGKNFSNKIWNALKLIHTLNIDDSLEQSKVNAFAISWFEALKSKILTEIKEDFDDYRLSEALKKLYSFIWSDFCSWYLEAIKPSFGASIDSDSFEATLRHFEDLMLMLHPFMPFLTEEVWHELRDRKEGDDCIVGKYPIAQEANIDLLSSVEILKELISKVREIRNSNQIKMSEALSLNVENSSTSQELFAMDGSQELVIKMANLSDISFVDEVSAEQNHISFLSGNEKYFLLMSHEIDIEAEREKIEKEIEYTIGFIAAVDRKLSNEKFVNNAPEAVVAIEKKKKADGEDRLRILEENLGNLSS